MQVNNIQNCSSQNRYSPTFKKWYRTVYKETSSLTTRLMHKNNTWFYREENLWKWLAKHLSQRFANTSKVNIYNYGCSNGIESYTFLMELISNYKEDFVKKLLPIKARDYDPVAIERANTGIFEIESIEKDRINSNTGGKFNKFFQQVSSEKPLYKIKDEFKNMVEFNVADIRDGYKEILPENSLVLARNFWPYLGKQSSISEMATKLYNQMGKNSLLVIGDFDICDGALFNAKTDVHLIDAGFVSINGEKIFEKEV